jgi:hypothetical protein
MRLLRITIGSVIAAIGVSIMLGATYYGAIVTRDNQHPHETIAFAVCLAGLGVLGLGLWIAGYDFRS